MYGYAKEIDSRRKLKMKKKVLSVVLAAMCVVSMAAVWFKPIKFRQQ